MMTDTGPVATASLPEDALRRLCLSDAVFRERYDGWQLVGQGAFGWVVRSQFLGHPIALKIFPHLPEDGRTRFRTEFASAVRVTSPFAIRTYSAFERGGLCWIEMEAVEGTTLKDELERRVREKAPFPMREGLEIARAVAWVLAEAHGSGVVHRDIKPANILLPRSGKPVAKLGDFGIARIAGSVKLTATGAFPGTPHFGAPEAFAGRGAGPAADVYAFSLCLYALFTSNGFPWVLDGDPTLETLITAHVKRPPRSMRLLEPSLPETLDDLVLQCLHKQPERRPTAAELVERLARISVFNSDLPEPKALSERSGRLRGALLAGSVLFGGVLLPGDLPAPPGNADTLQTIATPVAPAALSQGVVPLEASLRGHFIQLKNGPELLKDVRVTLVSGEGMESSFTLLGELGAEETTDIALDFFSPPPRNVRQVRVRAKRVASGPLDVRMTPAPKRVD
jgi:serine/threonine protein kinase